MTVFRGYNGVLSIDGNPIVSITDLTLNDEMEEADVSTRKSAGLTNTEPTLRNLSFEFQLVNDRSDAQIATLRTAYITRQSLSLSYMTDIENAEYEVFVKVSSLTRGQELRGAQTYDVVLKPCSNADFSEL